MVLFFSWCADCRKDTVFYSFCEFTEHSLHWQSDGHIENCWFIRGWKPWKVEHLLSVSSVGRDWGGCSVGIPVTLSLLNPPESIITHPSADWRRNILLPMELFGASKLALRLFPRRRGDCYLLLSFWLFYLPSHGAEPHTNSFHIFLDEPKWSW